MPIDLNAYPAKLKLKLIHLGKQFGSTDTLAQANQKLQAHATYADKVAKAGFSAADAQKLKDARDMLSEAGVGRDTAKGQKKVTSKAYVDAFSTGQDARMTARSILEGVHEDLEQADAADDAAKIATVLRLTNVASDEAEKLAQQLDQLAQVLSAEAIKAVAEGREGAAAVQDLGDAAAALRKADQADAGVQGTPAETQVLNHIDGIIVQLVRRARKAAVAVGRKTGDPALADAFKLDKLYQSRAPSPAEEQDQADDEDEMKAEGEPPKGEGPKEG